MTKHLSCSEGHGPAFWSTTFISQVGAWLLPDPEPEVQALREMTSAAMAQNGAVVIFIRFEVLVLVPFVLKVAQGFYGNASAVQRLANNRSVHTNFAQLVHVFRILNSTIGNDRQFRKFLTNIV